MKYNSESIKSGQNSNENEKSPGILSIYVCYRFYICKIGTVLYYHYKLDLF